MSGSNRKEKLKKEGYVETLGPNRSRRIWTLEEYEAFMKKLDAHPDQVKAELMKRMLNPVYHKPKSLEKAEPITREKIEHFNKLRNDDRVDTDKELLQHTYFLFPKGKKDDYELWHERNERAMDRSAFCGVISHEGGLLYFAYIVGIKIPKDAEQIIICHVDEKKNRIKYDQAFRVFGNSPIREIDETLEFYYPERGFSIVQGWNDDSVVADAYPRPKRYYSKNIYMAMQVFDFDFEKNSRKVEKALSKKFRTDAAFADSLKETCFVKWSDVLRIESDSKN